MRQRVGALARPGAIAITVAGVGLAVATVLVKLTTPGHAASPQAAGFALVMVPFLARAAVGLVLLMRQPANPVGWLVSASLIAFDLLLLGSAYTDRLTAANDMPRWRMLPLAVLATLGWSAGFPLLLIVMPLVFPDGHVVSRRWRWAVRAAFATIAVTAASTMLAGAVSNGSSTSNLPGRDLATGMLA